VDPTSPTTYRRSAPANSVAVTVLVIVFQAAVAKAILARRAAAGPALVAGEVFSIVGALTASPVGTVSYLLLAAIHFRLARSRTQARTVP
jgi:hypothetical protein